MMPRHAPCLEVALALESQAKMQGADAVVVTARKVTITVNRVAPRIRQAAAPRSPKRSARVLLKKNPVIASASVRTKTVGVRKPMSIKLAAGTKPTAVAAKQPRQPAVKVKLASTRKPAPAQHAVKKPSAGKKLKVATAR